MHNARGRALPVVLVEVAGVCEEGGGEEDVSDEGAHLGAEVLRGLLPVYIVYKYMVVHK